MPHPMGGLLYTWPFFLGAALAYLLGSVPFGLGRTKLAGYGDIRRIGSGNIGATNVLRTGNKGLAVLTLVLDGGKGAVAVLLGANFGPDMAAVAAASRDEQVTDHGLAALALEFDAVLGLGLSDLSPADLDLRRADAAFSEDEVQSLVDERDKARAARDFARSDQIREELARAGVAVEDQPGGTSRWRWS